MTHFGCGKIYSDSLIANCLLILRVKVLKKINFENRLIFGEFMRRTINGAILVHPVYSTFEALMFLECHGHHVFPKFQC